MTSINKQKVINDPIYGFITIPNSLVYDLIQHPYFQRLRRISQMGLSYFVYPGVHHTRFHHALGCLYVMQKAIYILRSKGVALSEKEENALYVAILLHDIGHGPFSHAMEHSIVQGVSHEDVSLLFMNELNGLYGNELSLAIQIYKGEYPRKFMLQLISSQLDVDRLDYLKRDSFYSGVAEGNINSERLIQMFNVVDDQLVIEEKGIYSIEQFIIARRLMYWQIYFHKTSIVAEQIVIKILKRARELVQKGVFLWCSEPLRYFIENKVILHTMSLNQFALLDDFDVMSAIKSWQYHKDPILSSLCHMIINRELLKIKMSHDPYAKQEINTLKKMLTQKKDISFEEVSYYIFDGKVQNQAYDENKPILILRKDNTIADALIVSDQLNIKALSKQVTKYFICYPKQLLKN